MNKADIKQLEGWLTMPEVAKEIGRKRTRIHQMIEEGKFYDNEIRYISNEKRIYLISVAGVERYKQAMEEKLNSKDN